MPQTATLPVEDRLARLGDSTVHWGVLLALFMVVAVHYMMEPDLARPEAADRPNNPRTAIHCGLDVKRLTFIAFAMSAGLAGLAGAVDVLAFTGRSGPIGTRPTASWSFPWSFLARFNGFAVIAFVFFFAVLMIGGESAARRLGVPSFFVLVLVALLMLFFAVIEFLDHARRSRAEG